MFEVFPTPKTCELEDRVFLPKDRVVLHVSADIRSAVDRILVPSFRSVRIPYGWAANDDETGYAVHIDSGMPPDTSLPDISIMGDEAYAVSVGDAGAYVTGNSSRGLIYGVMTLSHMVGRTGFQCGTVVDVPSFAYRGIVEGYFGIPFSDKDRLDLIEYIGRLKMNTYLYGPKDDHFHRVRWREPYSDSRMTFFVELVDCARSVGVDFGWAAGPGFTVRYSDDRDVDAMISKFGQLADAGVRLFAIFYDDIFPEMQYPEDRSAFSSLAEAQGSFTTRVRDKMHERWPDARLLACPTEYRGDGDSDYVIELGAGVPNDVPLFWTGPDVCSRTITSEQARALTERMGRPPAYWDNYPVNDASMVFDLHVGPLRGRDETLGEVCWGMLFNPMNLAEASKIPLFTAADYTWNSGAYNPEKSWRSALRHVDEACSAEWELILDHTRKSCLDNTDASRLDELVNMYNDRCRDGVPSVAPFKKYFADMAEACKKVVGNDANTRLASDAGPWLKRFRTVLSLATDVVEVLAMGTEEQAPDLDIVKRMRRHVMYDLDALRERFVPHIGHRSLDVLALRAMRVSEDIMRGDADAARDAMKEPLSSIDW